MTLLATIGTAAITNTAALTALTSGAPINWTFIIATFTICLTALATLIKIFSNPLKKEDKPGADNLFCQNHIAAIKELLEQSKVSSEKTEKMRECCTEIDKVVSSMLKDNENLNKGIDEMKKDYRELAHRLDGLLKQLMSWMSED